jgi:hypothetical protein
MGGQQEKKRPALSLPMSFVNTGSDINERIDYRLPSTK